MVGDDEAGLRSAFGALSTSVSGTLPMKSGQPYHPTVWASKSRSGAFSDQSAAHVVGTLIDGQQSAIGQEADAERVQQPEVPAARRRGGTPACGSAR